MAHNLPAELSSFVGRDAELAEIEGLLAQHRMVTLTGVGGVGKTRLALRVANRRRDQWRDGVWLRDLGSIADAALVPQLVAASVGVRIDPGAQQFRVLAAQLQSRQILLCLDTCEHLLEPVGDLVDEIVRSCPDVSVLATSREPLGVVGEAVWRVPSMSEHDSVRLFGERAALVAPGFEPDEVVDDIRLVCERVDHIPLAVELAAAWVRAMTPAQIAAGLDRSLRLLTGGPRTAVPRHRTLLASMGWSHDLLTGHERSVLRRLSVFADSFTLDAARAVALEPGADEARTLEVIGRLLDTSFVTTRAVHGSTRYRLLDTIRQYGEDQLQAAGETETTRDLHLDYFLELAERAERGFDADQDAWQLELDSHRADVAAALRWGLTQRESRASPGRRLTAAMARHWMICGQSADGLRFLTDAIALEPDDDSIVQARLHAGVAMLGMISGRTDLVDSSARRGAQIAAGLGVAGVRARCLALLGYPTFFVNFERCQAIASEAGALAETGGDAFARDLAGALEGYSLQTRNRHAEAVELSRATFARSMLRNDRFCAAFARGIEIYTSLVSGDVLGAVAVGREVVDIVTPLGDYFAVGTNTCNAAHALVLAGHLDEARELMEPIAGSLDREPDIDVVGFMVPYGLLHLCDGDLHTALQWLQRGVRRMTDTTSDWTAGRCLPGLVGVLRRMGHTEQAREWAERAVRVESSFGAKYELSDVLDEQGRLVADIDGALAREIHLRALALRHEHGLRLGYADSLDALAGLAERSGDPAQGVRLLACSDAARARIGYPRRPVDQPGHAALMTALQAAVPDQEFDERWRDGTDADLDTVVAGLLRGRGPRNRPATGWDSLTTTELDIVRYVTEGLTNPEIAARLYMSRSTVKAHLSRIYVKLDVRNRAGVVRVASAQHRRG